MTNSRIFCIAFFVWTALAVVSEFAGAPVSFQGLDKLIAQVLIGVTWGVAAVALAGDRKANP